MSKTTVMSVSAFLSTALILVLVVGAPLALFAARRRRAATGAVPDQIRRIRIHGNFEPSEVHIRAGAPARLIFRREETAACSERVVFPDYGISVMLPPFEDIVVDLPAREAGEHEFTCQMQVLHGRLIIDSGAVTS